MLSDFCFSKENREIRSVVCGSAGFDDSNEWYFGGPGKSGLLKKVCQVQQFLKPKLVEQVGPTFINVGPTIADCGYFP